MGCAGSKEPEPPPAASDPYSMDAVKAKLAESADQPGFKKDKTFKRKFNGFKVGGGSRHDVRRAMTPEEKAEAAAINAKLKPQTFAETLRRSLTRSFSRKSSSDGSSGNVFRRSISRMFTRGKSKSGSGLVGAESSENSETAAAANAKWRDSNSGDAAPSTAPARKSKGVGFASDTEVKA